MNKETGSYEPRILIVDDNAAIHDDFRKILGSRSAAGARLEDVENALFGGAAPVADRAVFRIDSAYQGQDALGMVQKAIAENDPYNLAFVDVRMPPGWDGVETLTHIWKCSPDLQAVICTAYSDYSWDDFLGRFGQVDNLLILKKPFETVEVLQAAHALTKKWSLGRQAQLRMEDLDHMVQERTQKLREEMEQRKNVQEALRISEERFSKAFQVCPMPMAIQRHPQGSFLAANSSFLELTGYSAENLLQRTAEGLRLWEESAISRSSADGRISNRPRALHCQDGTTRNTVLWAEPIKIGNEPCLLLIMEDVTEQLKLEGQLRQAQKMEAVGRLAAGIAHEFNNILTIIQGHAGLLRVRVTDSKPATDSIDRIDMASQRASSLTHQLLAFSRKQPLQLKPIDLSVLMHGAQKTLGRLLGEHYELRIECPQPIPPARADEGSVEQVLINLAQNARDAMPAGGKIIMQTGQAILDEESTRHNPDARAGRFATVSVTDFGSGMSPELLSRIFDPFFTTKEVGKGTGLGLSTIHGIVRQHQGWIQVASQVGQGSTFTVFLPLWEDEAKPAAEPGTDRLTGPGRGDGEAVLLVDDEDHFRDFARATLERGGYQVISAHDGPKALEIWDKCPVRIQLLVTDMVMPNGINGGALARILQSKDPELRVIYTSGHGAEIIRPDLPLTQGINFLPKPFEPRALLSAVRRCLDTGEAFEKSARPPEPDFLAAI